MKHYETSWNIMKYYETFWNIMKHYEILWNIIINTLKRLDLIPLEY